MNTTTGKEDFKADRTKTLNGLRRTTPKKYILLCTVSCRETIE